MEEKENLFGIIRQLKAQKKIVMYISHFLDEILTTRETIYLVLRHAQTFPSAATLRFLP